MSGVSERREGHLAAAATAAAVLLEAGRGVQRQHLSLRSLDSDLSALGMGRVANQAWQSGREAHRQINEYARQQGLGAKIWEPGVMQQHPEAMAHREVMGRASAVWRAASAEQRTAVEAAARDELRVAQCRTRLGAAPLVSLVGAGLHAWTARDAFARGQTAVGSAHAAAAAGHGAFLASALTRRVPGLGKAGLVTAAAGALAAYVLAE